MLEVFVLVVAPQPVGIFCRIRFPVPRDVPLPLLVLAVLVLQASVGPRALLDGRAPALPAYPPLLFGDGPQRVEGRRAVDPVGLLAAGAPAAAAASVSALRPPLRNTFISCFSYPTLSHVFIFVL
jgi:hypothetical protein